MTTGAMAAEPSITITPSTKTDGASTQGGGMSVYSGENVKLARALEWIYPGGFAEGGDTAALPPGRFDIKITGYPSRSVESFEALAGRIKEQFGVTVTVVESERDGFNVQIPPETAARLDKAAANDGHRISTSKTGWSLKAANSKDIAKWLARTLNQPVAPAGDLTTRFNFDIETNVLDPRELPAALGKLGITVTPAPIKVKQLKATKAG